MAAGRILGGVFAGVGSKAAEWRSGAEILESGFPVMRPSSTVRNRENLNHSANLSINNEDGKTGQLDLVSAPWSKGPALWCIHNSVNGLVEFIDESFGSTCTTLTIPASRGYRFFDRVWMEGDLPNSHSIAEDSLLRASSAEAG
jgi:hypothetical protein